MPVPVLHLVSRFWVGGSERQFIERLRAHPPGYTPIVACLEMSGGNLDDFLALKLPAPEVFPLKGSLLQPNTFVQVARLARLIRKSGARLVHGTEFISNFVGLLAARLAGVPVIVSRVDLGHLREGFGERHRAVEKWMSRNADAVSANAEAVRRLCIEEEGSAPGRTFVVPNGLDLERFDKLTRLPLQGPLPEGRPLIAVVANLWPVKGHRTLLEAIDRVSRQRPDARFVLVGDGPEREALQAKANAAVTFLGTRYDVPAVLARCDAFCLPSLAEGLPNAVMEAMAARLPVVASAVGGVPELVGPDTGFLASPGDANSLSAQLLQLLSDPGRASALGAHGRRKIEQEFSLRRLAERHRALYDALIVHHLSDVGIHPSNP
ncbi:MAG TPA: glycosyltransferase [Myxococcales bacterium]|jgi:glycosyltransferase involved in cell wall biosynthesis|nr:glycosyltransferase [Myxococcales bacterium]